MLLRSFFTLIVYLTIGFLAHSNLEAHVPFSDCFDETYNINNYKQNSSLQVKWAFDSLIKYPWKGNEKVLDLGSGDGKITAQISQELKQGIVIGLDYSNHMLKSAAESFSNPQYPNLIFLQGDGRKLPFKQQFDVVFSSCVLNWIDDQVAVLKSIKESLVPGGTAILVMPAKWPYNLSTVSEALSQTDKWKNYFTSEVSKRFYYSAEEYQNFIRQVGLEISEISVTQNQDYFENQQALIDWILAISSYAKALPAEKQIEFVREVAALMLTGEKPAADGHVYLKSPKLEIWLKKPSNS